jgi:hypothetical protein
MNGPPFPVGSPFEGSNEVGVSRRGVAKLVPFVLEVARYSSTPTAPVAKKETSTCAPLAAIAGWERLAPAGAVIAIGARQERPPSRETAVVTT